MPFDASAWDAAMRAFPSAAWYELEVVVITLLYGEERMLFLGDEGMLGGLDLGATALDALNEIERRPACLGRGDLIVDLSMLVSTDRIESTGIPGGGTFLGDGVNVRGTGLAGLLLQSRSPKPNPTSTEIG